MIGVPGIHRQSNKGMVGCLVSIVGIPKMGVIGALWIPRDSKRGIEGIPRDSKTGIEGIPTGRDSKKGI